MKYARLVLKNLLRNKRRTLLTILSIAVSLFVFSALVSLPSVASQMVAATQSSRRIVCHNKAGLPYFLPLAYRPRILALKHVEKISSWTWFGGIYHEPTDQFPNFAVDHQELDQIWPDWEIRPEAMAQLQKLRTACLVGSATMRKFNWHIGQQIMLRGTIFPINLTFQIVGVLGPKAPPTFLMFRRDYLEETLKGQGSLGPFAGLVGTYWIRLDNSESIPSVIAAIDESFANSEAETETESEAGFFGGFLSTYRALFTMAEALGIIVVATIGLVAANTAAMSIRERRTEIAVLRSLGFTTRAVLLCLLSECILIGVAGGLLGCLSGYLLLKVVGLNSNALGPLAVIRMPPVVLTESLFVATLIGLLSGLVPAASASRRNIVDALRLVA